MDEFLDDMDDEQVDDLLMPEEDETSSSQMYEHFRFVADKGQIGRASCRERVSDLV